MWVYFAKCPHCKAEHTQDGITECLRNNQKNAFRKYVTEGHFLQTLSCWTHYL